MPRPNEIERKIEAASKRREKGKTEIEAANVELGELFAQVIEHGLDLKAMAQLAGVSRTTAYKLAERSRKCGP